MIFLVEYDRPSGRLVTLRNFESTAANAAADARLTLELELKSRGVNHEVVLLDAADEDALRKTHPRYFENLEELVKRLSSSVGSN